MHLHVSSPAEKPDLVRRLGLLASGTAALAWVAGCSAGSGREAAPDVGFTLLDGTRSSTGRLRGQVVLINFWATSCASCLLKMPLLASTHQQFKARGLQTLAVAMQYDAPASVSHYAQTRALPFGVVIDNTGAVARSFGDVQATPTSLLLDRRGRIAWRWEGETVAARLHGRVERLLGEA